MRDFVPVELRQDHATATASPRPATVPIPQAVLDAPAMIAADAMPRGLTLFGEVEA